MSLNILCDGPHEHAPWSICNGVYDTSLEAKYTPMLARALATTVLEAVACEYKLPNVVQFSKRLKLSHFQALAAAKQPTKSMSMHMVPEYSHSVVLSNVPDDAPSWSKVGNADVMQTGLMCGGTEGSCECKILSWPDEAITDACAFGFWSQVDS